MTDAQIMQDALWGCVDDATAGRLSSELLRLGVVDTAEEAGRFARNAVLASNPPLEAGEAFRQAVVAVANLAYARLAAFGIGYTEARQRVEAAAAEGLALDRAFARVTTQMLAERARAGGPSTTR